MVAVFMGGDPTISCIASETSSTQSRGEEEGDEKEQEQQWMKRGRDNAVRDAAATILLHNRYVQVMLVDSREIRRRRRRGRRSNVKSRARPLFFAPSFVH